VEAPYNAAFAPTRWSLVLAAREPGAGTSAHRALAELCRVYWWPLYAFARRQGLSPQEAEDATQEFFVAVVEEHLFARAEATRGSLRSFLLASFQRDLSDARKAERRQKRGGGRSIVSLDLLSAEERLAAEPCNGSTPESLFDRQWALAVLEAAVTRLEHDYAARGQAPLFIALRPFLTSDSAQYEEACAALELSRAAARQAVHRLRERFGAALRSEIADTLANPSEEATDSELQALRAALAN